METQQTAEPLPSSCESNCSNPYSHNQAHVPVLGYVSYLVTGDYFYLEELQFWTSWFFLNTNAAYRNYADGLWYTETLRGQAWNYRNLGYTAYITPDDHGLKTFFEHKVQTNLANDLSKYVSPGSRHKTIFGTAYMAEGSEQYRTWMDDFFTWSIGNLVDLGYTEAQPLLEYKVKFPIGRMGEDVTGDFCFQMGANYTHPMGPGGTDYYASWAEVYSKVASTSALCGTEEMARYLSDRNGEPFVLNQMTGYQAGAAGYVANMQPALAMAVQPDYSDYPNWAIIPRTSTTNVPEPEPTPDPPTNETKNMLDTLQPGYWLEIPNSNLSSVSSTQNPPGDQAGVTDAWSGGLYDTKRDQLIVWGGGHLDYGGNEVYAFSLSELKWKILRESGQAEQCVTFYSDGSPSSTHSYNSIQYVGSVDRFVYVGGSPYGSNCDQDSFTSLFNFETNAWERGTDQPDIGHTTGFITAYNPKTGDLWAHGTYGGSKLAQYDPLKNEWTAYGSGEYLEIYATAAIDPDRRLMVAVGWETMVSWDLDNPAQGATNRRFQTSGDSEFEDIAAVGFVFDPVLKKFVGWGGGTSVYVLDPDTWIWTKVDAAPGNGVNPGQQNDRGTYGRFRYVPSKNIYVVVNTTTSNVFAYKLSEESGVKP